MPLRTVKPLSKEQWDFVVETLMRKPTKEEKDFMRRAVEHGSKLKVVR